MFTDLATIGPAFMLAVAVCFASICYTITKVYASHNIARERRAQMVYDFRQEQLWAERKHRERITKAQALEGLYQQFLNFIGGLDPRSLNLADILASVTSPCPGTPSDTTPEPSADTYTDPTDEAFEAVSRRQSFKHLKGTAGDEAEAYATEPHHEDDDDAAPIGARIN